MQHGGGARDEDKDVSMVQTVRGNYEGYTKREVLKAKEARHTQAMMGNPSEADYGHGEPQSNSELSRNLLRYH